MIKFGGNSLVTRILLLFILFNMLSLFLFSFYVLQRDRQKVETAVEETLREITSEKANVISLTLGHVSSDTENLASWAEAFITSIDETQLAGHYVRNEEGVLYRAEEDYAEPDTYTMVFFPSDVPLNAENASLINATERLDPFLSQVYKRHDVVQWAYISTEQGMLRLCPYGQVDMYERNHQQKGDPFYVAANPENNPDRVTVWTTPYADYLGTGWMVTSSHPVYKGDIFVGVASLDVRIETLQEEFLVDFRLGDSGKVFVLEDTGSVIYYPDLVNRDYTRQGELLLANILEDPAFKSSYRQTIRNILNDSSEKNGVAEWKDEGVTRIIAYSPIEGLPWLLAVEIDQNDFMAVNNIEASGAFLFISVLGLLLIAFSIFLYYQYSKPMASFIHKAEMISNGDYSRIESNSNLSEIKTLSSAFNAMSDRIRDYTGSLIKKNNEIESIINSIGGLLMIMTPDYEVLHLNKKGKQLFQEKMSTWQPGGCPETSKIWEQKNEASDAVEGSSSGLKCYEVLYNRDGPCKGCKMREAVDTIKPVYTRVTVADSIFSNGYFPSINEEGYVEEIVVHSQEITERVLMEKELIQTEKLAGIGQISSAISHEFKNPLAIIKGAVCLLDIYMKKMEEEQEVIYSHEINETVKTIAAAVNNAEKTVYNLLDFSGRYKDEITQADVGQIVNQILLLSNRERIRHNLQISVSLVPDPLIYTGQIEPLKNILQNVITNGINALGDGGNLAITGRYVDERSYMELKVRDDGKGVPSHMHEDIFKPFFTTDESGKGTGMGLWVTKLLVEKMDGKITMTSREGEGAEFTVLLPQVKTEKRVSI